MKKKITWADILQLSRFAVVGVSNTIIDVGILNLLLWLYPSTDTWRVLGYNSIAILLGSTNSFFFNKYWTFQQRNRITAQEVFRFVVLATSTTVMNDGLMFLLSKIFPTIMQSSLLGANALKLGAIIGTMSISFFGMRLWVFLQKKRAGGAPHLADMETLKLPALKMAYDVTVLINGVIRPVYEVETVKLPAITLAKPEARQLEVAEQEEALVEQGSQG